MKPVEPDWKSSFKNALMQQRFWETRKASREAPRKVPFKFQYRFICDDVRCTGHQMMIEDWELGAFYWSCIDKGATQDEACESVKKNFLGRLCAPELDTHFYVGTVLAHPKSWVVIGVYYPKKLSARQVVPTSGNLFDL